MGRETLEITATSTAAVPPFRVATMRAVSGAWLDTTPLAMTVATASFSLIKATALVRGEPVASVRVATSNSIAGEQAWQARRKRYCRGERERRGCRLSGRGSSDRDRPHCRGSDWPAAFRGVAVSCTPVFTTTVSVDGLTTTTATSGEPPPPGPVPSPQAINPSTTARGIQAEGHACTAVANASPLHGSRDELYPSEV